MFKQMLQDSAYLGQTSVVQLSCVMALQPSSISRVTSQSKVMFATFFALCAVFAHIHSWSHSGAGMLAPFRSDL